MKRRQFIKHGAVLSTLFATQPALFAARERLAVKTPLKHFVFVNLTGAPSQMEMFDPKPKHKNGGPTKTIKTKIKDVLFADTLENLAENSNHMAVMRMTSTDANHGTAQGKLQYAGANTIAGIGNRPSLGAISAYALGKEINSGLPRYVTISAGNMPGGFLGNDFSSYNYGGSNEFDIPASVKSTVKKSVPIREKLRDLSPMKDSEVYKEETKNEEKALYVIEKGKEVFDASLEPAAVKASFDGGNANQFMLTNRLINYGVSTIQINIGGWDTHSNCFTSHTRKVGDLDKGLGGLITQLKANGKFKETLILVCGEFGRTPRINETEGRDHFATNWGAALISGSIENGQVFGESSKDGYYVNNGVSLDELLFSTLEIMGTPARLNEKGKVPERLLPSGGSIPGFKFNRG